MENPSEKSLIYHLPQGVTNVSSNPPRPPPPIYTRERQNSCALSKARWLRQLVFFGSRTQARRLGGSELGQSTQGSKARSWAQIWKSRDRGSGSRVRLEGSRFEGSRLECSTIIFSIRTSRSHAIRFHLVFISSRINKYTSISFP